MDNKILDDGSKADELLSEDFSTTAEVGSTTDKIIKSHVIASMALGLVPVPVFDVSALTTTQMSLLRQLCERYEISFTNFDLKSLLTSLLGGSLPIISVIGLSSLVKIVPGFGSIAGMASLSMTAGSVTYAIGKVFSKHFENGGTIEDFDMKQARSLLKSEFEYGKSIVGSIKENDEFEVKKAQAQAQA